MKFKVHRLEVKSSNMAEKLEQLLNQLDGEVVGVVPHVTPTFSPAGAAARTDFLLIIEKKKEFGH